VLQRGDAEDEADGVDYVGFTGAVKPCDAVELGVEGGEFGSGRV